MRIAVITDNNFFIDFGDTVVMVNKRKFCSFLESSWVSKFPDLYTTFSTNEVNFFKIIRANQWKNKLSFGWDNSNGLRVRGGVGFGEGRGRVG